MELNIVGEQAQKVPLKAMKRVKQTKNEEYFYVEEIVKTMQPILYRVDNKEQIDHIVSWLEQNCI